MSRNDASPILSSHQVRFATQPFVPVSAGGEHEPVVTLRREGDIIREIHIRCKCGEVTILECDYPAGNGARAVAPRAVPAGT
jgi:hypothetical protein